MKKLLTILLLTITVIGQMSLTAHAEECPGDQVWDPGQEECSDIDWGDDDDDDFNIPETPEDYDEEHGMAEEGAAEMTEAEEGTDESTGDDDTGDGTPPAGNDDTTAETDEKIEGVNTEMPTIPKPDVLPGPSAEGQTQASVQEYFRSKAVPTFVAVFIGIIGLMAFVSLIISGIQFLTAYGNEESISKAKRTATYAVIGFLLAILSYAIVSIISSLSLGTSILDIPTVSAADDSQLQQHIEQLLPSEKALIEESPNAPGVSLPSGDLATDIIPQIVNILLAVASTVMFIALSYAGILLLIARGNEEDINKAQNIIIYAVIGIIIIALSYAIVYGVARLNINP